MAKAPKIKDYIVLADSTAVGLMMQVKSALDAGWIPLGGVAVNLDHLFQTMTHDKEQ